MSQLATNRVFVRGHADHRRAIEEELINQITHGSGFLLAAIGAVVLLVAAGETHDAWRIGAAAIYSVTLVALYAASTLSHSFLLRPRPRHFFRMVDQVCIFMLIAGTFTPFGLIFLRDGWTWWLTVAIWSLAVVGAVFKVCFSYSRSVGSSFFVMLGWMPLMAMSEALARIPAAALFWVLFGGLLYTVGTLFLARDHFRYFHAVWHLLVMAASACHYWAIFAYAI
jgi:hemolysin III